MYVSQPKAPVLSPSALQAHVLSLVSPAHVQFIAQAVADGALFCVSNSGGKDSQAMAIVITALVPAAQIVQIHADLGDEVEHLGVIDHIRAWTSNPLHIAQAIWKDGTPKTLLGMIAKRLMFPSPAIRWCTSDLKRGPIAKVIRRLSKDTGRTLIVSCLGLRGDESAARSKRPTLKLDKRNSKAGREWYELSPIHGLSTAQVFDLIAQAGQEAHPAYAAGNERLSCVFCIMGSDSDLKNGARLRPDLYGRYVQLERTTGHTFQNGRSLEQIVGIRLPGQQLAA